ncbi:MAG: DUF1275 domain-containing protein [Bdellovibrionales bacterium]|nr:DUF1275 domain-containing protein [Bdellovibrionales bacterium]
MFHHHPDERPGLFVQFNWFLLCFSAGSINAGGFLATGRFVSHVTGFATLFGVDLAESKYNEAFGILTVPMFFLLGAFISGWLVDRPSRRGRRPRYDLVMLLGAALLFASAALSLIPRYADRFGTDDLSFRQAYLLMSFLCMACGLQNGAMTTSSRGAVRTTHLTGLLTDLGVGITRILFPVGSDHAIRGERYTNWLRAGSVGAFVVGSAVGGVMFLHYEFQGFLLPAAISLYAAVMGRQGAFSRR